MKRRLFLLAGAAAGGALLVGVGLGLQAPTPEDRMRPPMPAADGATALNAWLTIAANGRVTVAMPRAEMGQGVHTALAQLLAEELDADWSQIGVADVPVERAYANQALLLNVLPLQPDDDGRLAHWVRGAAERGGWLLALQVTGGSSSVRDAWGPLRHAGALARQLLLQAAAARWNAPLDQLRTAAGQVVWGEQRLGYGALAAEAAAQTPPDAVPLKSPAEWKLIGQSLPRLDLPAKADGRAVFGIDVRPAGLLHAALRQSPSLGGRISSWDAQAVRSRPGIVDAFQLNERTAVVVADRWWRAEAALKAHPPQWLRGGKAVWNTALQRQTLQRALDQREGFAFRNQGDVDAGLRQGQRRFSAEYELPFLAHAPLEPTNASAQFADGRLTIWAPTQAAALARWKAAQALDLDRDAVTVHTTYLGGGFGRRLETEVVEQVVRIAARPALNGRPVQLLWNREEDFTQAVYRPMAIARFEAALGADGLPLAWRNTVAGPSLGFDTTDRLLPGMAADTPDKNHIEGAYDLPYAIPNLAVRQLRVPLGLPAGSWRSVGHSLNAFFTEGFLDELAVAAGQDPLRYRERLLASKPRHLAVLRRAAEGAGWGQPAAGPARGIALHESFGSICAQVVEMRRVDGKPKLERVVVALDCGSVVNPDTVRAQMEGSVVFALTAALHGEITVEQGEVQQKNFPQQPLLTLAETPRIDVHLIASQADPGGVGEPGVPPLAPALVNAYAALTGERIRRLPLRL